MSKIKVEIWSDIVCPFCYIGKRHFENALRDSGLSDSTEVVWKSFELQPGLEADPNQNIYDFLAEKKQWSPEQSREMHRHVTQKAAEAGLTYDFDSTIPANSFDAHRLIHFAADNGVQDAMKERLLSAYFIEGENIGDVETLIRLAAEIGLSKAEAATVLKSDRYADDVEKDVQEAKQMQVQGVPFFVMNRKYAVSGAQPVDVFIRALNKTAEDAAHEGSLNK
ncbi:MAG: DsbA family oxidoreductase [Balneolaceae bacterium]|nr:DsbA family oxidoreductase [Balneolaceae bacterium]